MKCASRDQNDECRALAFREHGQQFIFIAEYEKQPYYVINQCKLRIEAAGS